MLESRFTSVQAGFGPFTIKKLATCRIADNHILLKGLPGYNSSQSSRLIPRKIKGADKKGDIHDKLFSKIILTVKSPA